MQPVLCLNYVYLVGTLTWIKIIEAIQSWDLFFYLKLVVLGNNAQFVHYTSIKIL